MLQHHVISFLQFDCAYVRLVAQVASDSIKKQMETEGISTYLVRCRSCAIT